MNTISVIHSLTIVKRCNCCGKVIFLKRVFNTKVTDSTDHTTKYSFCSACVHTTQEAIQNTDTQINMQ
jgi:hypothetical protein